MSKKLREVLLVLAVLFPAAVAAQDEATVTAQDETAAPAESPLTNGPYIAPMGQYILTDDNAFDDGLGGVLAAGYRSGWWAVEASGLYGRYGGDVGRDTDVIGGTINALVFPFGGLPNLFGLIGAGGLDVDRHPEIGREYSLTTIEGGLGYIFPLSMGMYDFGIRADARYRYGHRESRVEPDGDLDIANDFKDVLFNLGLQLPLGFRQPPPPPPPAPPPARICADGSDNDGDAKVDFPADPGCTSADDDDETDPPQCSDGKDNDGDGLIDFPADKGCSAAEDNDEVDPCKSPEVGERVSLKGCGTGDTLVLRGVNFDFDKSTLTANAKTILDNVGEELTTYPDIKVELSGHTDAMGTDEYNQGLSERRAVSVRKYLLGKDIADDRMSTAGYGESQPIADNETDEGRELNRRVELKVTAGVAAAGPAAEAPAADAPVAADAEPATEAAPAGEAAAPEAVAEPPPADAPSPEAAVLTEEPPEPSADEILPPVTP